MSLMNRLRKLEAEASPGSWEHIHIHFGEELIKMGQQVSFEDTERARGYMQLEADAVLVVELRNALPKLLAVVEAAEAIQLHVMPNDEAASDKLTILQEALAALEEEV